MSDDKLYHYTSSKGKKGIEESGMIRSSVDRGPSRGDDARFGEGVYLTEKSPDLGRKEIYRNNYDGDDQANLTSRQKQRVSDYFEFDKKDLPGVKQCDSDRDVWLHPGDLDLSGKDYSTGKTKKN